MQYTLVELAAELGLCARTLRQWDFNQIDPNQKLALDTVKTLSQKLEFAQKNPIWDSVKLTGTVGQKFVHKPSINKYYLQKLSTLLGYFQTLV